MYGRMKSARTECEDAFFRVHERDLRLRIFQHEVVGDDSIQEPWFTLRTGVQGGWGKLWGVEEALHASGAEGGAVE